MAPVKMSPGEIESLAGEYARHPDTKLRERLVKANMDLVVQVSRKYACETSDTQDDLVQVGCIGLMRAVEKFDPRHNVGFRTFASRWIAGEILHYLRDNAPLVRPPRELQEMSHQLRRQAETLSQEIGQDPTDEQLAAFMGIPVEKIRDIRQVDENRRVLSLDATGADDMDSPMGDRLEDRKYHSFQLDEDSRIMLLEALGTLREQSQQVIDFAFYQDLTQTEIARHLKISQMQVSRRLKTATQELWKALNTRVTPW